MNKYGPDDSLVFREEADLCDNMLQPLLNLTVLNLKAN